MVCRKKFVFLLRGWMLIRVSRLLVRFILCRFWFGLLWYFMDSIYQVYCFVFFESYQFFYLKILFYLSVCLRFLGVRMLQFFLEVFFVGERCFFYVIRLFSFCCSELILSFSGSCVVFLFVFGVVFRFFKVGFIFQQ